MDPMDEEPSSIPDGFFSCQVCNLKNRREQDWLLHMTSQGHQRILTRRPGGGHGDWGYDPEFGAKAVVLEACNSMKASPLQIAEYLSQWGRLDEFICPTSLSGTKPEKVYALYREQSAVEEMLKVDIHRILDEPVLISRKYPSEKDQANGNGSFDSLGDHNITSSSLEEGELPESQNESFAQEEFEEFGTSDWEDPPPKPSDKWSWSPENMDSFLSMPLQDQLPKLFNLIALTSSDNVKRTRAAKEIQEILRKTFSSAYVFPYGHDLFGCAIRGDILRLCVDPYASLGNKTTGIIPPSKMSGLDVAMIHQICSTHGGFDNPTFAYPSLYSLPSDGGQELSFTYKQIQIHCRFENFVSVQKSRLLRFILRHDLRIWPLVMLLRYWKSTFELFPVKNPLRECEDFEDYTLILLLIFFLTKIKVIPSIMELESLSPAPLVVNNNDIGFAGDHKIVPPAKITMITEDKFVRTMSTLGLLKDFFGFIGGKDFDYQESVICTATGEFIPRKCFKPHMEKDLPKDIKKKYQFTSNGDLRIQKLDVSSTLVVQDPLILTDNAAKGFSVEEISEFVNKCRESVELIGDFMDQSKPNALTMFDPRPPEARIPTPPPVIPEPDPEPPIPRRKSSPFHSRRQSMSSPSFPANSPPKISRSPKSKTETTPLRSILKKRRISPSSSSFPTTTTQDSQYKSPKIETDPHDRSSRRDSHDRISRMDSHDRNSSRRDSHDKTSRIESKRKSFADNHNNEDDKDNHSDTSHRKIIRIARISVKEETTK